MANKNKFSLYAIWGVACLPVLTALFMYFAGVGVPEGRSNAGQLLAPGSDISQLGLNTPVVQQQFNEPRWLLLVTEPEQCATECQEWLHQLQQIKTALGRDTDRVEYRLVQTDGKAIPSEAPILTSSTSTLEAGIWVADPLGNLVLRYNMDQPPRDILDDLKRLLKVSKIG